MKSYEHQSNADQLVCSGVLSELLVSCTADSQTSTSSLNTIVFFM